MLVKDTKAELHEDHEKLVLYADFLWFAPITFVLCGAGVVMAYYIFAVVARVQELEQLFKSLVVGQSSVKPDVVITLLEFLNSEWLIILLQTFASTAGQ